jgi:hypothetical protein
MGHELVGEVAGVADPHEDDEAAGQRGEGDQRDRPGPVDRELSVGVAEQAPGGAAIDRGEKHGDQELLHLADIRRGGVADLVPPEHVRP